MLRASAVGNPELASMSTPDFLRYIFMQLDRIKDSPEALYRALASPLPFKLSFEVPRVDCTQLSQQEYRNFFGAIEKMRREMM